MNYLVLTIVVVLLVAAIVCMYRKPPQTEGFAQVMGALGPYQKQIAQAINNSNREPVDRRLGPQNNFNAGEYIWSTFTQMRKDGIPPQEPRSDLGDCKKQCATTDDRLSFSKCVSTCSCRSSVLRFCKDLCQYSKLDKGYCNRSCIANKSANCNSTSWTYMFGDMV